MLDHRFSFGLWQDTYLFIAFYQSLRKYCSQPQVEISEELRTLVCVRKKKDDDKRNSRLRHWSLVGATVFDSNIVRWKWRSVWKDGVACKDLKLFLDRWRQQKVGRRSRLFLLLYSFYQAASFFLLFFSSPLIQRIWTRICKDSEKDIVQR